MAAIKITVQSEKFHGKDLVKGKTDNVTMQPVDRRHKTVSKQIAREQGAAKIDILLPTIAQKKFQFEFASS